ncbi:MAG: ABC transporter substrate-binding protein [Blastocatellia bacterium]|nr:ABC transporter substrate-binding protein [Blastocatellia bacterium]
MRRFIIAVLFLGVLAAVVVYLERRPTSKVIESGPLKQTDGFPRTLTARDGSTLVIPKKPERIVSLTLSTDEILLEICPKSRIAALHEISLNPLYSNCVEASQAMPVHVPADPERVLKLQPDLIFVASYSRAEALKLLAASGAPVFKFESFDSIEGIKQTIREIGYAVGEESGADGLVKKMEADLKQLAPLAAEAKPRVLAYSQGGASAAKNTVFDDCVRLAGGINLAAEKGLEGFPTISPETVLEWNPDFIVVGARPGEEAAVKRKLLENPALAQTKAAKLNHIMTLDPRIQLTVSHHIVKCVQALAAGLHPTH